MIDDESLELEDERRGRRSKGRIANIDSILELTAFNGETAL